MSFDKSNYRKWSNMKRSEMIEKIKEFLHGNSNFPGHLDEAESLLNFLEREGMAPPLIPTGASGWEIGKGASAYIHEWDKEETCDN